MKNKKIILPLLTALLFTSCDFNGGTTTSSNDSQLSDSFGEVVSASSSEEVNSNFPFDEIKTFFNTDIVPPSFEGEEISIEKSEVNNAQYVTVYTVKNDKASNDYFNTYLKTLGYNDPIYVNNEVEGEYYYVDSTSTLPYQVVYYEETIDDVTYFIVQYSFGDSYSDDYTITTSFPDAEIKAYLGLTESIVSFVSSEYYYAETEDDGYLCFFMYITDGSMNADSYYTLLSNASYIIEQYTTTDGLEYYDAYNQDTGYEVLFYDLSDDNSFNLQIYSLYEDSIGGDEEIEYTEYTSFPGSNIKTFLNGTNELPSYESDKYYYYEDNLLGLLKYVFVYSTISTTACNDAYKIILENASYVVEYDEEEEAYYAYNETSGYSLYFYEEEGNFCLTIYEYFDYSDDGDDYGDYDEYTSTTTFPDAEIKTYLGTTNSVISFEASEYYYAETEDYYGYTCFFLYILDGSMNADSYYKLLNNASYTIEPIYYEDSTELSHYDAYNEEAGYEILFWDESEDDSFNIQIYALDDSTIDDGMMIIHKMKLN